MTSTRHRHRYILAAIIFIGISLALSNYKLLYSIDSYKHFHLEWSAENQHDISLQVQPESAAENTRSISDSTLEQIPISESIQSPLNASEETYDQHSVAPNLINESITINLNTAMPSEHSVEKITEMPLVNSTATTSRHLQNLSMSELLHRCSSSVHEIHDITQPLGVFILPQDFDEIVELHHYMIEGVNYSPCLYREMDPSRASLWIYDRHRGYCEYTSFFEQEVQRRKNIDLNTSSTMGWKIFFIDFVDGPFLRPCDHLIRIVQDKASDVIHGKRSTVSGRQGLNHTGHILNYDNYRVIHIPYGVRSDLVYMVQKQVLHINANVTTETLPTDKIIFNPICPVDLPGRSGGARYFWHHPSNKCIAPQYECHNGNARNEVADALLEIQTNISTVLTLNTSRSIHGESVTDSNMALTIEFSGGGLFQGGLGRQKSSTEYALDLLTYRIVVVTQRDLHEDHYRLMEAFVGGALVFTDLMLAPPKKLVDGEHYIVYRNVRELQEKIVYYLEHEDERRRIALAGWTLVMENYRSWHLMESLLLREEEP